MSEDEKSGFLSGFIVGTVLSTIVLATIVYNVTVPRAKTDVMRQVYERGHAVQCLGKTGYYWECADDRSN